MAKLGRYDGDLQMFVQEPQPLNLNWLAFLRYLVDTGTFDQDGDVAAYPPAGPLVAAREAVAA